MKKFHCLPIGSMDDSNDDVFIENYLKKVKKIKENSFLAKELLGVVGIFSEKSSVFVCSEDMN